MRSITSLGEAKTSPKTLQFVLALKNTTQTGGVPFSFFESACAVFSFVVYLALDDDQAVADRGGYNFVKKSHFYYLPDAYCCGWHFPSCLL